MFIPCRHHIVRVIKSDIHACIRHALRVAMCCCKYCSYCNKAFNASTAVPFGAASCRISLLVVDAVHSPAHAVSWAYLSDPITVLDFGWEHFCSSMLLRLSCGSCPLIEVPDAACLNSAEVQTSQSSLHLLTLNNMWCQTSWWGPCRIQQLSFCWYEPLVCCTLSGTYWAAEWQQCSMSSLIATSKVPSCCIHFIHLSFNVLGVNRGPTDNQSMNSEV